MHRQRAIIHEFQVRVPREFFGVDVDGFADEVPQLAQEFVGRHGLLAGVEGDEWDDGGEATGQRRAQGGGVEALQVALEVLVRTVCRARSGDFVIFTVMIVPPALNHGITQVSRHDPDDSFAVERLPRAPILIKPGFQEQQHRVPDILRGLVELVEEDDAALAGLLGEEVVEPRADAVALVGDLGAEEVGLVFHLRHVDAVERQGQQATHLLGQLGLAVAAHACESEHERLVGVVDVVADERSEDVFGGLALPDDVVVGFEEREEAERACYLEHSWGGFAHDAGFVEVVSLHERQVAAKRIADFSLV